MKKKSLKMPIDYLKNDFWEEYGEIGVSTITTTDDNPYFNNDDIGHSVFFYDDVKREDFLFDKHFYAIATPTDPVYMSHFMQLTITENEYIFSPISTFNNMKPVTLAKDDSLINDIVLGKLLFTFHDFDDSIKFPEEEF